MVIKVDPSQVIINHSLNKINLNKAVINSSKVVKIMIIKD
jgi:hypothetical protein